MMEIGHLMDGVEEVVQEMELAGVEEDTEEMEVMVEHMVEVEEVDMGAKVAITVVVEVD